MKKFLLDHKTVFKNTFWLGVGEIFNKAGFFLLGIWIARTLGPEGFGSMNFIKSTVIMTGILMDFGINKLMVKNTSKDPSKTAEYLTNLTFVKIILGILTFLGMRGRSTHTASLDQFTLYILIYCGYYILNNINEFLRIVFRPYEKMEHEATLKIITGLSTILIVAGIVYFAGPSLLYIFWGYLISAVISGIITLIYIPKKITIHQTPLNKTIIKETFKRGCIIFLNMMCVQIYSSGDKFLLGIYGKLEELGIYTAIYKLFNGFLIQTYIASFIPHFLKVPKREKIWHTMLMFMGGGMLITLIASIRGKQIISLIYGNLYSETGHIYLIIISTIFVFKSSNSLISHILISVGQEKKSLYVVLAGALVSLGINLIVIPKYGALGACVALGISVLVMFGGNLWSLLSTRKHREEE